MSQSQVTAVLMSRSISIVSTTSVYKYFCTLLLCANFTLTLCTLHVYAKSKGFLSQAFVPCPRCLAVGQISRFHSGVVFPQVCLQTFPSPISMFQFPNACEGTTVVTEQGHINGVPQNFVSRILYDTDGTFVYVTPKLHILRPHSIGKLAFIIKLYCKLIEKNVFPSTNTILYIIL